MRHDAKLGLALGMLVIGFAVAFCFPRQPEPAAWEKPDVPAPIADSTLDFLPIKAYQPTPADAAQEIAVTPAVPPQPAATPITIEGSPLAPAPIAPLVAETGAPQANPKSIDQSTGPGPLPTQEVSTAPPELYIVKAGDTLSSIAGRCLGSSARYQQLYEANQNILSSPNDLKIGMELKIPSQQELKETAAEIAKKDESPSRPWKGIEVRRSPQMSTSGAGFQQPPTAPWLADRPQERH